MRKPKLIKSSDYAVLVAQGLERWTLGMIIALIIIATVFTAIR